MASDATACAGDSAPPVEGLKVFDTLQADDKEVQLLIDEARLNAYVKITFKNADSAVSLDEVLAFLQDRGVKTGELGLENITKALPEPDAKPSFIGPFLVARGKGPTDGLDGQVEWLVQRPDTAYRQTAGGRVDYRERNRIINVQQGQKILRILDPTPGQPGADVFGNAIACQQGRGVTIRRGKNVDVTEDGREYYAQTAGMLQESAETIAVEPAFIVSGDVDLAVGNISFIGPVKITGDVRDGFYVKAGKEIEVGGMVESADLDAGAFIRVQGGVAGKGKARLRCKAGLEARYLSEVSVEAAGDIAVANSITNASVKSLGRVSVGSGGIRGSNVVAWRGLKSPEIGSDMGVKTVVVVGIDYHLKDRLVNVEREMAIIREAVEKIENALGPLLADGSIVESLPRDKADIARRLMVQLDMLVKRGDELASVRGSLFAEMQVDGSVFIEVGKKIFPGVVMQIGTCRRTFELEVEGPVKLYPDIENGSVRVSR